MKQETYFCDLCHLQVNKDRLHIGHFVNVINGGFGIKDDERYTDEKLDLCDKCLDLCTPVIKYSNGNYKIRDYNKNGYSN
jgi:hypothetical protein